MANKTSELLDHIVSIFDEMPLVNTIEFRDDDIIDIDKENIYPLVSIRLIETPEQELDMFYEAAEITVLNQRDILPKPTTSKLMLDTNYIDNIGICSTILNDFYLEIAKTHNDLDIDIVEKSSISPVSKYGERNFLDGKSQEFIFSMHQNNI